MKTLCIFFSRGYVAKPWTDIINQDRIWYWNSDSYDVGSVIFLTGQWRNKTSLWIFNHSTTLILRPSFYFIFFYEPSLFIWGTGIYVCLYRMRSFCKLTVNNYNDMSSYSLNTLDLFPQLRINATMFFYAPCLDSW